jgi:hypothetical protein
LNSGSLAAQFTVTRTTSASRLVSSSSTALPSASANADNGPGVGTIAGYAAATLAGIAAVSIVAIWLIRRKRRRDDDADIDVPFNRQSWLRNSTMLSDNTPTPASTNFPPPRRSPEMIDRSFNATPVTNYGGMNQYPQNNFGYATQPSYQPGAVIFSPSSANTSFGPGGGPATPLPFSPGYDHMGPNPNPFEQEAGYTEVTRGGPPSPFTPYQQQQFDDIQRQMTPTIPNVNLPAFPVEDRLVSPHAPSPKMEVAPPFFLPSTLSRAFRPTLSFLPRLPLPRVKSSKSIRRRTKYRLRPCSMILPRDLSPRLPLLRPLRLAQWLRSPPRLSSPLPVVRSHALRRCMIPKMPTAVSKEPTRYLAPRARGKHEK